MSVDLTIDQKARISSFNQPFNARPRYMNFLLMKHLTRHLPLSLRRAMGDCDDDVDDPGRILYQRYYRAGELARLLPTALIVQWRRSPHRLTITITDRAVGQIVLPPQDMAAVKSLDSVNFHSAAGRRCAWLLRMSPDDLSKAVVLIAECAKLFPTHQLIEMTRQGSREC